MSIEQLDKGRWRFVEIEGIEVGIHTSIARLMLANIRIFGVLRVHHNWSIISL
jgi:hypothetical protein